MFLIWLVIEAKKKQNQVKESIEDKNLALVAWKNYRL